jgi:hypothetical protein
MPAWRFSRTERLDTDRCADALAYREARPPRLRKSRSGSVGAIEAARSYTAAASSCRPNRESRSISLFECEFDMRVWFGKARLDPLCFSLHRWIVCGSIRPTHLALGGDRPGDAVRIASDALNLLRGDRMEELEADEVETGL